MRQLTLSEISNLDSGEIIPSFTATIKKVFDQATGQGNYGQWWAQGMELVADGETIHATWFGEDNLSELEGQTRLFESSETQHGKRGLVWEVKNKKGKTYSGVKITETAKIKPVNGDNLSGGRNAGEDSNIGRDVKKSEMGTDQRTNPLPAQNTNSVSNSSKLVDGFTEARRHLCQAANLYNLCVRAVDKMIAPELPLVAQNSDMFQAATGTLFIEASRAGFVSKMPVKPVPERNEKAERMPANKEKETSPAYEHGWSEDQTDVPF